MHREGDRQPLWIELIKKRRLIFNSTVGYETITFLNIFFVETKVNIHTFNMNHFIDHKHKISFSSFRRLGELLLSPMVGRSLSAYA